MLHVDGRIWGSNPVTIGKHSNKIKLIIVSLENVNGALLVLIRQQYQTTSNS